MTGTDARDDVVALLTRAYDLAATDEVDTVMTAVRHACRMGLDAASGANAAGPTLASFGEPAKRRQKWIIHYQDAEVGAVVYDAALYGDAEAELLAREHYERASVQWNCTLMRIAALDPADEDRHHIRAEALEKALRALRGMVGGQSHPDDRTALAAADALLADGEAAR
jgi:hypothetical protein